MSQRGLAQRIELIKSNARVSEYEHGVREPDLIILRRTLPLENGAPRQSTRFDSERIFSFAWTRDAKQFAVTRGTSSADIILMKDFR